MNVSLKTIKSNLINLFSIIQNSKNLKKHGLRITSDVLASVDASSLDLTTPSPEEAAIPVELLPANDVPESVLPFTAPIPSG